eukprot:2029035-Prymnesium_polylepis.3
MDVAAAVASLSPRPQTVEVLSSGLMRKHGIQYTGKYKRSEASAQAHLKNLSDTLVASMPGVTVVFSSNTSSVDRDFFRMVAAPQLVTGVGSFALAAAAARSCGQPTRTPATRSQLFPCNETGGGEEEQPLRQGEAVGGPDQPRVLGGCDWKTYAYKCFPLAECA